jgi:cytidine deaminase
MAMNGAVWLRLEILTISFLICHSGGVYVLMPAGSAHDNKTVATRRQQQNQESSPCGNCRNT